MNQSKILPVDRVISSLMLHFIILFSFVVRVGGSGGGGGGWEAGGRGGEGILRVTGQLRLCPAAALFITRQLTVAPRVPDRKIGLYSSSFSSHPPLPLPFNPHIKNFEKNPEELTSKFVINQ